MAALMTLVHAQGDRMLTQSEIFLCDGGDGPVPCRLYAVLDELTLTYRVIQRLPDGQVRELRHHVASLRDARRWAREHRLTSEEAA